MPDGTLVIPGGPSFSGTPTPPGVPPDAGIVNSFNTRDGDVVLNSADVTAAGGALLAGPQTHTGQHTVSGLAYVHSHPTGAQLQSNYSGVDGYANNWLWGYTAWFGSITGADPVAGGHVAANKLVFADAASIGGATNMNAGALLAMSVVYGNPAAGNTAARNASNSNIAVIGKVGVAPTSIGPFAANNPIFVSQQSFGYATVTQGGLGGYTPGANPSIGYYRGSLFGGNDNIWLANTATNYFHLIGREIDVAIYDTATVHQRIGLLMACFKSTSQATGDDAGIMLLDGDNQTSPHKVGIQFGATTAPHAVTDSLIKVVARSSFPGTQPHPYPAGIDFTQGTFSGNAIATPGFSVSGAGNAAANRISSNPSTGLMQISINGVVDGPTTDWLWSNIRWFGTSGGADPAAGGWIAANKFMLTDAAIVPSGNIGAFLSFLNISGNTTAGNTAFRAASMAKTAVSGQIGPTPTLGVPEVKAMFAGSFSVCFANASQGGLGGWTPVDNPDFGYFRGSVWGGLDNAYLDSGASNYGLLMGREIDTAILGTATTYGRYGLLLASNTSARQAIGDDVSLLFVVEQRNGFNHKNAIQFGSSFADHQVSDSLIKVVPRQYPAPSTPAYVTGIDFTGGTFSGNAIATPGFAVSGAGRVSPLLTNAANDAAAASAGVPVGAMYRNGNAVMVRLV